MRSSIDIRYLFVVLSLFCLSLQAMTSATFGMILSFLLVTAGISVLLLAIQVILFCKVYATDRSALPAQVVLGTTIAVITVLQLGLLMSAGYNFNVLYSVLWHVAIYAFMFAAAFLPLMFAVTILRKYKGRVHLLAYFMIAFSIFVMVYFFLFGFAGVIINDAEYIGYHAGQALLAGQNPYALNYSGLKNAAANGSINSYTTMTSGRVVGVLIYPAMYVLAQLPFNTFAGSLHALFRTMLIQETIYLIVLVAIIAYFGKDVKRAGLFGMIAVLPFMFLGFISFIDIIIVAALAVACLSANKWYFGIALGIAVSMQQLAWPPAVLLLALAFCEKGVLKGAKDATITALTFLAVSSYFILLGPLKYFGNLLHSTSNIIPYGPAPFGYMVLRFYPIPLPDFVILFYFALAICTVLFVTLRDRRNIGVLSLVPILFIDYGRIEYYIIYIALAAIVLGVSSAVEKRKKKIFDKNLLPQRVGYAVAGVLLVCMFAFLIYAHSQYQLRVSVSGPHLIQAPSNEITYVANFSTGGDSGNFRVLLYLLNGSRVWADGLLSTNIAVRGKLNGKPYLSLNASQNNSVSLPPGLINATVSVTPIEDNGTFAACAIYNTTYFYLCPSAGDRRIP